MTRIATNLRTFTRSDLIEFVLFFSVPFVSSVVQSQNSSFVFIRVIRGCRLLYSIPVP